MKRKSSQPTFVLILCLLLPAVSHAAGDLTAQPPIEVTVNLGDAGNQLRFYPATLTFETGKLYKLVIKNPSREKHYFTAEAFSRAVFTRKVEIVGKGKETVAEVKGHIGEIEVYPGGTAEWWFVPVKTLKSSRLYCSIAGHAEAGMTGRIDIQ